MVNLFPDTLSIIPCSNDKRPLIKWERSQVMRMPYPDDCELYGVVCGAVSDNLECIDYDAKNDPSPELTKLTFEELISATAPDLWAKIVIQETPSGGWHILYRTNEPVPRQHVICRNDAGQALFETRGEGGYFCTSGEYRFVHGDLHSLATISAEERNLLRSVAATFGEAPQQETLEIASKAENAVAEMGYSSRAGLSPFDDYDQRHTPTEVLLSLGWRISHTQADITYLTRPGKDYGVSASVNHPKCPNRAYIFTTSTPLTPNRSYKSSSLYAILYHGGDFKAAARELRSQGYGHAPEIKDAEGSAIARDTIIEYMDKGPDGDAELLKLQLKDTVAYDAAIKGWVIFSPPHRPGHWARDVFDYIHRLTIRTLLGTYHNARISLSEELNNTANHERANYLQGCLNRVQQRIAQLKKPSYIGNVLLLSKQDFGVQGDAWDSQPHLLGVANGVVNLRDGSFRPAEPRDRIRRVCHTNYTPSATCPAFTQFVNDIMVTPERVEYLHKLLGYAITGEQTQHIYPVLYGPRGRNGKDTLINALYGTLGRDLAKPVSPDTMMVAGNRSTGAATPELYDLMGIRLAVVNEAEEHARIKVAQIKALTGGTTIKARPLHGDYVEFDPTHLLILVSNHRPSIPAHEEAMWARVHLLEFDQRFVDDPQDGERKIDRELPSKLAKEREGILLWLIDGARQYYSDCTLRAPDSVRKSTSGYRADMDTVSDWVESECSVGDNLMIVKSRAYLLYNNWCKNNAHFPVGRNTFYSELARKGFTEAQERKGAGQRVFLGLDTKVYLGDRT